MTILSMELIFGIIHYGSDYLRLEARLPASEHVQNVKLSLWKYVKLENFKWVQKKVQNLYNLLFIKTAFI